MGRIALITTVFVIALASLSRAADFTLVRDGKSDSVIYLPEAPSTAEAFAAEQFAHYVERMSGASLKIQRGGEPPPNPIVLAGRATIERTLAGEAGKQSKLPELRFWDELLASGFKLRYSGEFVGIGPSNDGLVIVSGRDGSLLRGVYYVLDQLGCRFLAPNLSHYNGSAERVPRKGTLALSADQSIELEPKLKFRKLYVEEGHSHDIESLKAIIEWMPKVGYNVLVVPTDYQGSGRVKWDNWRKELTPELQKRGIVIEVGGHGYQNFLNAELEGGKLFEQHPAWFGQDNTGQRRREKGRVFCTSNPQAVAYLIDNFSAYVKDRPEIQIFDFWPPDGAKWCECEACEKLGSPSDRQAILVQQVQERIKTVRPDLRLEVLAYHTSVYPPERVKLDKEILLDFCPIAQQFDHQINDAAAEKNADYVKGLTAWRQAFAGEISIYSYYRKYAWDSLPVIIPHYMQKDLQWYATLPVQGVSTYAEPGDWFTYELNHYVLVQLAWDVDADVDAIVRKFCDARYADESGVAQAAMATLEKCTRNYCSIPHVPLKPADQIKAAQIEMQETVAGISTAQGRANDKSVKRSLKRLELMCTYALRDLEIQHLRATDAERKAIESKAAELHKFIESNSSEGVFLMRGGRLSLKRMFTRYGINAAQ